MGTVAVIDKPLSHVYPKENAELQRKVASEYLIISQVPLRRYERQDYRKNRLFFPERNITMSALTEATIIVEAGETSGTLIQARAAVEEGRRLRTALGWRLDGSGAFGWAIGPIAFRRLAIELNEHGIIDLAAECGINCVY